MTNEEKEKAIEIAAEYFPIGFYRHKSDFQNQIDCQKAVIQMSEWKNQQFKTFLEMKREQVATTGQICLIDEIINELFKEE